MFPYNITTLNITKLNIDDLNIKNLHIENNDIFNFISKKQLTIISLIISILIIYFTLSIAYMILQICNLCNKKYNRDIRINDNITAPLI